ncbi:MAG: hypothetical protein UZ13_03283 [Chloroflexi bacterium OLB13]|nr:MAG: hypothetical protein UZ13_03283 [Chloroflexi bacterium OLB13]
MRSMFEAATQFLVDDGWPVKRIEETNSLHMLFKGENGVWTCIAHALEERRSLLFYSVCPIEIPPEQYGEVMEFITHANYGMLNGAFEFDLSDGDLRYRTALTVPDADPTPKSLQFIIYDNVTTMDLYLPGLYAVASGETDALHAIDKIERHLADTDDT